MRRSSMSRTYRNTGPTSDVVDAVLERDDYRCVPCGEPLAGERGVAWAVHHRKGRDGARANEPQNLIPVHGASNVDLCHGRIHGNRSEAQDNGWSISRNTPLDPLNVAVLVAGETRYVYLTADASYADAPPERGAA